MAPGLKRRLSLAQMRRRGAATEQQVNPSWKESRMSPDHAGRFTDAATVAHLVEHAIHRPAGDEGPSLLDDAARETALAADPKPPRPVNLARVGPSRNAHSCAFNDPSNYLG
jgi:hypothetical protein